jgi:hypothetical protein
MRVEGGKKYCPGYDIIEDVFTEEERPSKKSRYMP